MYLCPALQGEQDISGFRTVVEYGHVVEGRRILNTDLEMVSEKVAADSVVCAGVPLLTIIRVSPYRSSKWIRDFWARLCSLETAIIFR